MVLLVTGAGGHIGSGVARMALAQGLEVVATYRGSEPPPIVGDLRGTSRWVFCDLINREAVAELVKRHKIDRCIHCAAIPNEAFARPNPRGAFDANVTATANLLEQARLNKWQRIIMVSTGSVFQLRPMHGKPILEDEPPEPKDVYSTTKTTAEMLCRMYRTEYGLSASVVRISWVYGPPIAVHAPTRGPIPSFLARALSGERIDDGGGDFAVSFTFVDDVANGLLAAARANNLNHPIYHLGSGKNITLGEAAEAIKRAVPGAAIALADGTDPWTQFTALRDPLAGTKLEEDTGWKPQYSIDEGVKIYADWLRQNSHLWSD